MRWLLLGIALISGGFDVGCFSAYNHTGINARPPAPCVCKCEVTPSPAPNGETKK